MTDDNEPVTWDWLLTLGGEMTTAEAGNRFVELVVGEDTPLDRTRLMLCEPPSPGADVEPQIRNDSHYDDGTPKPVSDQVWLCGRRYTTRGTLRRLFDVLGVVTSEGEG